MHKDKCVEIARQAAVDCGERHDYMPATDSLANTWQPHRWVVDAMLLAAQEAETEHYHNGNTELKQLRERVQHLESLLIGWCDHGWSKEREAQSRAACSAGPSDLDVSARMAELMLVALKKA